MDSKQTPYRNSSHTVRVFEVLQSFRKNGVLCDIKLKTDDGVTVNGHKVVLASASPYFRVMFTGAFLESNEVCVKIRELDSVALQLSIDYMYTAQILVTDDNVQALVHAASLLELQDVQDACWKFLRTQLSPLNCLGIRKLADVHGCLDLLSSADSYARKHFSRVVDGDEFLSLSSAQVIELISNDNLTVPSEEKVFESVICWVNHNLSHRKDIFTELMKHVRLPLTSREYLLKIVKEEPLLKNNSECKDYIIEALDFHVLQYEHPRATLTKTKRTDPRHAVGLHKVILVVDDEFNKLFNIQWYDPVTDQWHCRPDISIGFCSSGIVIKDQRVFAVGGLIDSKSICTVQMLDLSSPSPSWEPTVEMSVKRSYLGVAILNNCIYAVGGINVKCSLKSVEVFNCSTQKWRMISDMNTRRSYVGVGVLNNLLYVVGGYDGESKQSYLKSVECYDHNTDTWTLLPEMSIRRNEHSVGVLDGVLYAVGGENGDDVLKSVEAYRPCARVWISVADMHICRQNAGVVAFNGLLYVVGGNDGDTDLDSVELYDPDTNTWSMLTATMNIGLGCPGVAVIDKPLHF